MLGTLRYCGQYEKIILTLIFRVLCTLTLCPYAFLSLLDVYVAVFSLVSDPGCLRISIPMEKWICIQCEYMYLEIPECTSTSYIPANTMQCCDNVEFG